MIEVYKSFVTSDFLFNNEVTNQFPTATSQSKLPQNAIC